METMLRKYYIERPRILSIKYNYTIIFLNNNNNNNNTITYLSHEEIINIINSHFNALPDDK